MNSLLLPLLLLLLTTTTTATAHNITRILAKHPEFSTFNHYLTVTHLAGEINRRQTITVLAIDNAAMSSLLDKHLTLPTLKNVLSLHVLVDYFGAKKLHQINNSTTLVSSMFQATGAAAGTAGYVNITNLKGGKVGFAAEDNDGALHSFYVKSVQEVPYYISVLQISHAISSADAEAPTAAPSAIDLISIMSKQGCKAFADLLRGSKALPTFKENIDGGLTVFCPSDAAVSGFAPKYKNLSDGEKVSLLLYHGVPVYQSLQTLKSSNGLVNTLATEGANKYDLTVQTQGEDVALKTKVNTATIVGTLIDQDPFVAYKINKVLMPRELFKESGEAPAESPKAAKKKKGSKKGADDSEAADGPADAPSDDSEDQKAADENSNGVSVSGLQDAVTMLFTLLIGFLVLILSS
ncbi:fasciclin-like arabinogalactan protein 2 [Cajanus cajan]|uniref:Fasciclin-like arabinogalactan protein 2 n=1 Tax=Cajanus cajan TaxID=3821 RepID=A0A151RZY4_CAJCA|nr:fasciclin-like arabinogalactan protein 2 [Cajanus cajan]KYP48118.1 Fasciclin-like arabinogalactan protein 2 [Cajanus cajan]